MSLALMIVDGDITQIGGIGTISFIKDNLYYAFGHSFLAPGKDINLPAKLATTKTILDSSNYPMKLALPDGRTLGSLVLDNYMTVIIDNMSASKTVKLISEINFSNDVKTFNQQVGKLNSNNYFYLAYTLTDILDYTLNREIVGGTITGNLKITDDNNNDNITNLNLDNSSYITSTFYTNILNNLSKYENDNKSFGEINLNITLVKK